MPLFSEKNYLKGTKDKDEDPNCLVGINIVDFIIVEAKPNNYSNYAEQKPSPLDGDVSIEPERIIFLEVSCHHDAYRHEYAPAQCYQ